MENIRILIIEDNEDLSFTIENVLKKSKYKVKRVSTGEEGISIIKKELIDLVLLDINLPKMNGIKVLRNIKEINPDILVIMMTAITDAKPAIDAMKIGAYDYLMKPFELDELKIVVKKALETHELKREVDRLKRQHEIDHPTNKIFGDSQYLQKIREIIAIIASTPRTSVLILGESGTGKELVANAIHYSSARKDGPFIKINCSAIPDNLIESELFGHEKGAFTDAKNMKKGLFELANGGTLFLDELSSMKLSLQPKILRVLETQSFRRIGGVNDINIDVRVIAATNQDLAELVKNGEFRDDLYYRLKVMEITIPPLRERKEDIDILKKIFLDQYNKEFNKSIKGFAPETDNLIYNYSWPGNVRELKNVIERAVILCNDEMLLPEHMPLELKELNTDIPASQSPGLGMVSLEDAEKHHILNVLELVNGNKSKAARVLKISRSTLREKLKNYQAE
ncbi:sigma-54-dependent Fis family transcriptional regulator [candidate division KSB1 bacterium]|nr:MAG: sigma-54-dependent Fis family transcriptional regulator [candidate division KSB1 bacterium]